MSPLLLAFCPCLAKQKQRKDKVSRNEKMKICLHFTSNKWQVDNGGILYG